MDYLKTSLFSWLLTSTFTISGVVDAQPVTHVSAFRIEGKTYTLDELSKQNQSSFYEVDVKKYELIKNLSEQRYLEGYFQRLAEAKHTTSEKARDFFIESKTKPSEKEVNLAIEQFKNHPNLKELKEDERNRNIVNYLRQTKTQEVMQNLIAEAEHSKQLEILYPEPKEPIYKVKVNAEDYVRYNLNPGEIQDNCLGDACPITIVEYSDFQCPFCSKVQDASRQVIKQYSGKIRWIVRDYLLPFHERAKPAAIAAHCASEQGKYWEMYDELFKNQRNLADADIKKYAAQLSLDTKVFESCLNHPSKVLSKLALNTKSAEGLGVTGTPTFFINGKRMAGNLPFGEFKRAIDSSLQK